ncbi:hypothetical protein P4561_16210 [Priestia flexa]|nr:hypothetical protein [Priestia flexa]MED3825229.1 hypothetical protein [Priestia flexa]
MKPIKQINMPKGTTMGIKDKIKAILYPPLHQTDFIYKYVKKKKIVLDV